MATPRDKLAESLDALRGLQEQGTVAIRAADLSRINRERLLRHGFLQEVMKGWYIAARPDTPAGESTAWYASYWEFCADYLRSRFDGEWCLSPEISLSLHVGNRVVPKQLVVRSPRGGNKITRLPYETSLLDLRSAMPDERNIVEQDGFRLFSLPAALIACPPGFFENNPTDASAALAAIRDASEVLGGLLEGGHSIVAGRLAGAFRNIGRDAIAENIMQTMRAANYTVREQDPFPTRLAALPRREASPYAGRVRMMWRQMRGAVIDNFPAPPARVYDIDAYMKRVADTYVTDAYHSLSIEGYQVSPALIERVRSGPWRPDNDEQDREQKNALAARGYWQAFKAVEDSVRRVLNGENPGEVAERDHGTWYREMLAPSVTAGLLRAADLAGYRNSPVFIRKSMHVPPNAQAVPDIMPVYFELLANETEPAVRVVLGHFIFVYIHPYIDGNGRTGRFMMNVMLAAGAYPWTVVPLETRDRYMAALESASVGQDIVPFTKFLGELVDANMKGRSIAKV